MVLWNEVKVIKHQCLSSLRDKAQSQAVCIVYKPIVYSTEQEPFMTNLPSSAVHNVIYPQNGLEQQHLPSQDYRQLVTLYHSHEGICRLSLRDFRRYIRGKLAVVVRLFQALRKLGHMVHISDKSAFNCIRGIMFT